MPRRVIKKCANCGVDDARPNSEFCQTCADLLFKPKPEEQAEDTAEAAQTE